RRRVQGSRIPVRCCQGRLDHTLDPVLGHADLAQRSLGPAPAGKIEERPSEPPRPQVLAKPAPWLLELLANYMRRSGGEARYASAHAAGRRRLREHGRACGAAPCPPCRDNARTARLRKAHLSAARLPPALDDPRQGAQQYPPPPSAR